MNFAVTHIGLAVFAALLVGAATDVQAQSQKVRLSGLSDVSFGTIGYGGDAISAQSVCAYSSTRSQSYTVTAVGSGRGSDFALSSEQNALSFDLQWSPLPGQMNGDALVPNVNAGPYVSGATHQRCNNGPSTSASLIITIRSADSAAAAAGVYSGSITLLMAPM